jgi:hypothetical protein
MDKSLGYLRESLSNWSEKNEIALELFKRIDAKQYKDEEEFVRELDEKEVIYLNEVLLPRELEYAKNEQDHLRYNQLNDVFEQLI